MFLFVAGVVDVVRCCLLSAVSGVLLAACRLLVVGVVARCW